MTHTPEHTQAELNETRELLHRRVLSSVSHDLKTPLATVIGALEVYQRLQHKLTPEKREVLLKSALSEAYRLDSFITNILDMMKLESGLVTSRAEWCPVHSMLTDCITRLGPKRAQHHITIKTHDEPLQTFTDCVLLGRAVGLILDNAIQHGDNAPIVITYGVSDHIAFIRIQDHGPGIPPGKEEEIFSKYTRFNKMDYKKAGTGLGLPACRVLMQLLGGEVHGENASDGGAAFTLTYPEALVS
jgi:two-component system sensor histidine kinase KdpD